MPDNAKKKGKGPPREFLVVSLPSDAQVGATLRLLAVSGTQASAEKAVRLLDPGTLGRVAILERKSLYDRKPAVESTEINEAIAKNR